MRSIAFVLTTLLVLPLTASDIPLQNWTVPAKSAHFRTQANDDITNATVFIAVTPCRLLDTRNPVGPFGGPAFAAGETRTYDVSAGPCTGLPNPAAAYSMNFTILNYNVASGGFVTAYPANIARPFVSTVNFGTGPALANAAVIATGSGGQISVYASAATDLIIDLNGYYLGAAGTLNSGKALSLKGSVPAGGVIAGTNQTSTSGVFVTGVFGSVTATTLTDASGVMGYTTAGTTWGVKGYDSGGGLNSGGVLGIAGTRVGNNQPFQSAGVRGESQAGFGVLGNTSNAAGVGGTFIDAQGNILRSGYLGNNTYGVYCAGDFAASGAKLFVDPHPTDAAKVVRFVALEGPEAGTYFRGRGKFLHGHATIEVPEAFRVSTEEEGITVHLTPIGGLAMVAVTEQSLDRIEAEASRDVEFSYVVYGTRRGYKDFAPIQPGEEFVPADANAKLPAYLNEDQKRRLIENGTYNADGSVNLDTAARLGWDKEWAKRKKE